MRNNRLHYYYGFTVLPWTWAAYPVNVVMRSYRQTSISATWFCIPNKGIPCWRQYLRRLYLSWHISGFRSISHIHMPSKLPKTPNGLLWNSCVYWNSSGKKLRPDKCMEECADSFQIAFAVPGIPHTAVYKTFRRSHILVETPSLHRPHPVHLPFDGIPHTVVKDPTV